MANFLAVSAFPAKVMVEPAAAAEALTPAQPLAIALNLVARKWRCTCVFIRMNGRGNAKTNNMMQGKYVVFFLHCFLTWKDTLSGQ